MSDQTKSEFWQGHLTGVETPMIHFLPSNMLDVDSVREAAGQLDFAFFLANAEHVESASALMAVLANAMNFPSSPGHSWDALLDLTRDLSWRKTKGYVLTLSNADPLQQMADEGFSTLLRLLEATVREWRDERGEYGERTAPVPFHVVLSGSDLLRPLLLRKLKEPLCDHEANMSTRLVRMPEGVAGAESFRDAQRLRQSGADLELILLFLRDRGYGQVDSAYAVAALMDKPVLNARMLVDCSDAWSAQLREEDIKRRESARKALRDLGFS